MLVCELVIWFAMLVVLCIYEWAASEAGMRVLVILAFHPLVVFVCPAKE